MTNTNSTDNSNLIAFRSSSLKKQFLKKGESAGPIAQQDLERYYLLLGCALREQKLIYNEAAFLCDLLNGVRYTASVEPRSYLLASVLNAQNAEWGINYSEKWELDMDAFVQKIKGSSSAWCMAVLDAIERFWYEPDSYYIENMEEKLALVGLI